MKPITLSPLATLVAKPQDVTNRKNVTPFGVCVHTTGRGVPTLAKKLGISPEEVAAGVYTKPGANFPHYFISYSGDIFQVADEVERARHAGIAPEQRPLYISGAWTRRVSAVGLRLWRARWPGKKNPLQLFPGKSVNEAYLGVELIPLLVRQPTGWLFTQDQYWALEDLLVDIEQRHSIVLTGSRLVGHEDLEPLERWNSKGGWDPGALNLSPTFYWTRR